MWRLVIGIAIGITIGALATLAITSQGWLTASIRHNLNWDDGREWVSALSGWAAFIAAVASLPYLIGQWQEARKQTRFAIGDEDPSLDVIEHQEDKNMLVIRVVNWNRRTIFVKDIVTSTKVRPPVMNSQTAIWNVRTEDGEVRNAFPVQVNGWEDRGKRPSFARFDLLLLRERQGSEPESLTDESIPFPRGAKITAKIQMLGNVHRVFDLEADAFPEEGKADAEQPDKAAASR